MRVVASPISSFARSETRSTRARRSVARGRTTTRATGARADEDEVGSPRWTRRALAVGALALAVVSEARDARGAYGTAASEEEDSSSAQEVGFETFYGAANPPATYGAIGGTTAALAKYSYDVPTNWVEEATSKVEKGSGGQDSRFVKKGSRGEVKAYLLTLNRAGQDGAAFELTDSSLQAVAGALSEMQDSIANGRVTSKREKRDDGREYALFNVDADRKYSVAISIDNTGRLFAFVVTAPASQYNRDKKTFERMVNSFRVYSSVSQFV